MNKLLHFLLLVFSLAVCSQNSDRKYVSHSQNGNTIEIAVSDGSYRIRFYSDKIVETSFIPNKQTFDPSSHAVVMQPDTLSIDEADTGTTLEYASTGIAVQIEKSPFQITYFYQDKQLISEKTGYAKTESGEKIDFNLGDSEILYGGGARVLGMNRRGNRLQLYNRAHYGYENRSELMNYTIPMVLSSKIYAVHFDNAPIGWLDLDSKKDNTLAYETISGRKTYQVIAGESWDELVSAYTELTGRQPLPPRWALGNFASRFGYKSQKQTEATIAKFRKEKIPVDAVILDLYWFGKDVKGTMGNLEIFRDSFPEFEKMTLDFTKIGIKTIPITEPFILTTSSKWQEAVHKKILAMDSIGNPFTYDFYFGNTGLIDIFKPEGKQWFWDIYKYLVNKGAAGVWGDLGEPEVHPSAAMHATGSADQVHNIYGHQWAKLVYEGYRKDFPSTRPFILMRSGYSGSQRYGMIPWSGDVNRTWGGFSGQAEISLQMGMQGLAYMHSDLGGFAGANPDNELYVRWLQYGVFQPIFRPHAQDDVPPEPVYKDDETKKLAKQSVELRYKLLPYHYTMAFENSQSGKPLMRPLFFEEPDNPELLTKSNQYFWGDAFMIAPVTAANVRQKEIYFPKSNNWFDFYSGKKYDAGSVASVEVQKEYIPTFVRGGTFVPMIDVIQTTKDYDSAKLSIHYYYDSEQTASASELYLDDGNTPDAHAKGKFAILNFSSFANDGQIQILITPEKGVTFQPQNKPCTVIVHNLTQKPKTVLINGKRAKFTFEKSILSIQASYDLESKRDIMIKF